MTLREIAELTANNWTRDTFGKSLACHIESALREVQATERARLRVELDAAYEAGHWAWPTPDSPTRREARERYIAGRLAAIEQETP